MQKRAGSAKARASNTARSTDTAARETQARTLVVDIGGTKLKILLSGEHEPRKVASGAHLTPARMVESVQKLARGWKYDRVSIGYPGLVGKQGPQSEPGNLGPGWVGFNFAAAFDKPVRIINDALMQALGSYEGGKMLFLSFGTGLGSALLIDGIAIPMELGELPYGQRRTFGSLVGRQGLRRLGKTEWRKITTTMVTRFASAFNVDYTVLGGGNAKLLKKLPPGMRRGHNLAAFRGGFRLWQLADVPTLTVHQEPPEAAKKPKRVAL